MKLALALTLISVIGWAQDSVNWCHHGIIKDGHMFCTEGQKRKEVNVLNICKKNWDCSETTDGWICEKRKPDMSFYNVRFEGKPIDISGTDSVITNQTIEGNGKTLIKVHDHGNLVIEDSVIQ